MTIAEGLTMSEATPVAEPAAMLGLILPNDLPAELDLDAAETQWLRDRLAEFLAALADPRDRVLRLRALLDASADDGAGPAGFDATTIPAAKAEVEDFDRYFQVRRIRSDRPARALLHGLLQTAHGVLALAGRADLPPELIERQVRGFSTHARVLGRICSAGPLA